MFYQEENLWKSENGSIRSFSAMTNEHLANVICHLEHYNRRYTGRAFMKVMREVEFRHLSEDFLKGAPYPYQDSRDGKWYVWSFKEDHRIQISGVQEEPKKDS